MLGLVTTDEGPSPEFVAAFRERLPHSDIQLIGALDGLSLAEIDGLAAQPSTYPIQTILADETTWDIDITILAPLLDRRAHEMVSRGAKAIAICCSGDFPDIDCGVPVVYPGRLLSAIAGAVCRNGRIGVVSPIAAQMESARRKWEADGFAVMMAHASAFDRDEFVAAAREMAAVDVELVVLDCMDHTAKDRDEFVRLSGRPALAALPVTATIVGEILGR